MASENGPSSAVLGIDFGTSNSAAALMAGDGSLQVIPLDGTRAEMPTAVFFNAETHSVLFGSEAMQAYLGGTEGRLLRSLKSLLGSALMDEYTAVGERSLRYFDIVVLFFKELKRRSEAHVGHSLQHAVLGRPVHFVDDNPERDALAQQTLGRAAQEAGFTRIAYQLEPIAAALDYEQRVMGETVALVVDIGGGTSDFTVIRLNPARSQLADRSADILATSGVHIGGTDFDRLLDLATVMPSLGYKHIGTGNRPVPSSVFLDLSTWHLIHQAYTRKAMHFAKELWTDFSDQALHARLMDALEGQHGHRMLAAVEAAKIACSSSGTDAPVQLDFLSSLGSIPQVTASGMQDTLQDAVAQVVLCAQECVQRSGLAAVDVVYLTGGSSALAPLVTALQAAMPQAQLVSGNRFGGVAAGLAHAGSAWAGSVNKPQASEPPLWNTLAHAPAPGTLLGQRDALQDGQVLMHQVFTEADSAQQHPFRILLLRSGQEIKAFVNRCAHFGVPLATRQDLLKFQPHTSLTCNVHYARYRWSDGVCDQGDCEGEALIAIPLQVDDAGLIRIAA